MGKRAVLLVVVGLTCGCAVGPNYKKPVVNTPPVYRGVTPEEAAKGEARSLADEKWWEIFQDEQLKELIKTALQQNYDVRIAATHILEARAQLGITRANQFPTIAGDVEAVNLRSPQSKFLPAYETSANQVGWTSMLDVRQAEQLVFTAASEVPTLEQQIEQEENFISALLGNNPAPVPRGRKLTEQEHPPAVPAGLPSSLLERRPDIRQAEDQLISANAQIGVARAACFPQISLTATAGFQSSALTGLISGPAGLWNFGGEITQPIFTAGKLRSNVRLTQARQQEFLLRYEQTIQGAFRDVSDSLVAYRKTQEFRQQQELLVASAQDASRLSHMRYSGGVTSYLEVLTNETNYFSAELGLAQAQVNELLALVQVYKALGGGWEQ